MFISMFIVKQCNNNLVRLQGCNIYTSLRYQTPRKCKKLEEKKKQFLTSNKAKGKNISITTKVLNISQPLTNET